MKTFIIILIIQHFLADWILQPREIAKTKSSNFLSMIIHGITLFLILFPILWLYEINNSLIKCLIYCVLHCFQDELIWGILPKVFKLDDFYGQKLFFDFIAIDQALHLTMLFLIVL